MTKEALKLALETLEKYARDFGLSDLSVEAMYVVRQALAQPEQEKERCVGCEACIDTACGRDECPNGWPKAAQPEKDIPKIGCVNHDCDKCKAQPEQEEYLSKAYRLANELRCHLAIAPAPQRTWVGLTDEEIQKMRHLIDWTAGWTYITFARAIEAKLKEKNT